MQNHVYKHLFNGNALHHVSIDKMFSHGFHSLSKPFNHALVGDT